MKKLLLIIFSTVFLFACGGKEEQSTHVETEPAKAEVVEVEPPSSETFTSYYPGGQKEAEGQMINGTMGGAWTSWYESGQKEREENYLDGILQGRRVKWYENGQMKESELYKEGKLHGRKTVWGESGNVTYDAEYADGVEVEVHAKAE